MGISFTGEAFNGDNAIVLDGQRYDIGTRVYGWDDVKGYDGYTTERSVVKTVDNKTGKEKRKVIKGRRYGKRRGANPLRKPVDFITQLLVHHSGADRADPSIMYNVLYYQRGLSVHFASEDDERIWQFNDMIDRCFHAGKHNNISIGDECCLWPLADKRPRYYDAKRCERTGNLPHDKGVEIIHGRKINTYKFTQPQLESLARLYAGAWLAVGYQRTQGFTGPFAEAPKFPRNAQGNIPRTLVPDAKKHVGLIGHLQCTLRKIDPCGFPWEEFEEQTAGHYRRFKRNARF